jgi:hypothetical protein
MEQHREATKAKKALHQRLFWFLAGAGVNYLLISTPFNYLKTHTALGVGVISACSMGVSASFFFLWNYFINFRTDSRKRDALARYLTAVVVLWAISSLVLWTFKQFDAHMSLRLGSKAIDLDIVATQACFGWLKFIIYHKWVFPVAKDEPPAVPTAPSA